MKNSSIVMSIAAMLAAGAPAAAVTLAPPDGATTNVLQIYTGDTAVEIAGPGTVSLNAANSHTGGTTLSGGTLALSGDVPASGRSQIGAGALTITGGTLRGSGTVARGIAATAATTLAGDPVLALAGDNSFAEPVTISEGTVEISGGDSTFSKHIYLYDGTGFVQSGGSVTMGANNLQLSYEAGSTSSFTMTGGTFDVGGRNSVVGFNGGPVVATTDISGGASLRNIGNFYIHSNGGSSSANAIHVHDGGTLGFAALYDGASATTTLSVDGGTLVNDASGKDSVLDYFAWIGTTSSGLSSFSIGENGAAFRTENGAEAGMALVYTAISSDGATAGLVFDGGAWGLYGKNTYSGPTIVKNGATLVIGGSSGALPPDSAVSVSGDSTLRTMAYAKSVGSLSLADGATLSPTYNSGKMYPLAVTGSLSLPSRVCVAPRSGSNPKTATALTAAGTYAILTAPAASADAMKAVAWTAPGIGSGKKASFSVSASGSTATLSMTIAADDGTSGFTVDSGSGAAFGGNFAVSSDIVVNGTLTVNGNLNGSANGGSVTVNDGGVLHVAGRIRPVNATGNSAHVYVNEGGRLVANTIEGTSTLASEANATPMFHYDGGTVAADSFETSSDSIRYILNYQSAAVGEKGLVIDLGAWTRPEGNNAIVMTSVQGQVNRDTSGASPDGGITIVNGSGDSRRLAFFGSRFAGSTLNGGITVESGAGLSLHRDAMSGQTLALKPGSFFKSYNHVASIGNLTLGEAGATTPVGMALYAEDVTAVVSGELSVPSPVSVSVAGDNWKNDSAVVAGVYTALVYSASTTLDTSLFRLPAGVKGYALSATEVTLSSGDYDGRKALVVAIAESGADDARYDSDATLPSGSEMAAPNLFIGDDDAVANRTVTVGAGAVVDISGTLHIAYKAADGADKQTGTHTDALVINGGDVRAETLRTMYRGSNDNIGRANAEITLNGGSLSVAGDAQFGFNRTRSGFATTVTVNDGAMTVGGEMLLTRYSGTAQAPQGIVRMNGGSLDVAGVIDLSCSTNYNAAFALDGGVFLRGGVLRAQNIVQSVDYAPAQRLVFDGGTYEPNANAAGLALSGLTAAHVSTNGAVISTANLPSGAAYTIAQALLTDPALDGAPDGGLVKKGAGTLALSGANTYAGRTVVEAGTLAVANADAISDSVTVANGAAIEASGLDLSLASVTASGTIAARSLTVSGAIELPADGSVLSVDGDLTLARGAAIDFSAYGEVPSGYVPVAVASGTVTIPELVRARGAGENTRCETRVEGGVLYAKPTSAGFMMIVR